MLNTYRTRSSPTSNLKIVPGADSSYLWFGAFVVVVSLVSLCFSRIKPYSTAVLKLITSHLDSSLDKDHLCYGSLVEEGTDESTTPLLSPTMA